MFFVVITPDRSALCISPPIEHCSKSSTTILLLVSTLGSTSCFPGESAPNALICTPVLRSSYITRGSREGLQQQTMSAPLTASVGESVGTARIRYFSAAHFANSSLLAP